MALIDWCNTISCLRSFEQAPGRFVVQDQYGMLSAKRKKVGIRQACLLSPDLLLLVMTCVMMQDLHAQAML